MDRGRACEREGEEEEGMGFLGKAGDLDLMRTGSAFFLVLLLLLLLLDLLAVVVFVSREGVVDLGGMCCQREKECNEDGWMEGGVDMSEFG